MKLASTAERGHHATFAEAVDRGLAPDGGLYLPEEYPRLPERIFELSVSRSFAESSWEIVRRLLGEEIPEDALAEITSDAFNFPLPVRQLDERLSVLELFHGPTLAFKDVGARFMARVMAYFHREDDREIVILVATSGDTGGAVASGFAGVPGVRVVLLYPGDRVSPLQELQLTTGGDNITTLRVEGTFDDCQQLVKQAFRDPELTRGRTLTSANSINIARLLPQSFYFLTTWGQLRHGRRRIVFSIPSGNFGNVTAALMAREMGAVVEGIVAATNINDVFAEYLRTGTYRPRVASRTLSNAMDVGNPSNLVRVRSLFNDDLAAMRQVISTSSSTDEETLRVGREAFERYGYVFDPHGAVAYRAARLYLAGRSDETHAVILATAHPAKFPEALDREQREAAGYPAALRDLEDRPRRQVAIGRSYEELHSILRGL
jgi:threonine synthase